MTDPEHNRTPPSPAGSELGARRLARPPDSVLIVRSLREDDLDALLALYGHLHTEDKPLPPEAGVQVWRELMANPHHWHLGAFVGGELVSSCALTVVPNLTRGGRPYGVIENVVTHRAYRRRGIGRQVLAQALTIAWSVRCYKVMLATGRKDEAVTRFYVSAGFSATDKLAFVARPVD